MESATVIPAKAGIQGKRRVVALGPRFRGDDDDARECGLPDRESRKLRTKHERSVPMSRWRIGAVTVTRIVELEMAGGTRFILPQAEPDTVLPIEWLRPNFIDEAGRLRMAIQALVVETPARRIVVDTCLGNDKQGRRIPRWNDLHGPFLADLAAAGYPRQSIDTVLCTHLHVDHVGWNTMLEGGRWVPTFPRARYLMGRVEFEYWRTQREHDHHHPIFADSIAPVFEAGLVDLVETDHRVADEITLMPTLGHTPGHVSVRIASEGEEALITGDFIHHPCQMAHPEWSSTADDDPQRAERTRRAVFGHLAGSKTLLIGTHFTAPTAGRVLRDGDAFRLAFG
jgi:glyoxylase-like metal-dependent hydrolase (beta-lactamase superfamily II)